MDLREQQKAERRERILDSAREMIGAGGYESLTMRDLARAARVTVPTIYNLIGAKEAVLFAAIEDQTARFLATIETDGASSAASRAVSVVESCTREMLRMPHYYRSLLGILLRSEPARAMRNLVDRALIGEFERALAQMSAAGELVEWVDAAKLARALTAQLEFISLRWAGGALDSDALPEEAVYGVGMMLLGVATGASHAQLVSRVGAAQKRTPAQRARRAKTEALDAQA